MVLGHSALASLEALRWLSDVGAAFAQIDADGKLIACFSPQTRNDVRLGLTQALAATSDISTTGRDATK